MFRFLSKLFNGAKSRDNSSSSASPTKTSVQSLADNNKDIINGFRLSVTMSAHIPLKLLKRHGEIANKIPPGDADLPSNAGIWLPKLKDEFSILEEGRTMWSPAGHIPADGAEVLQYLIDVRGIIEAPLLQSHDEISEALLRLEKIKALPGGPLYTTDDKYQTVKSAATDYFPLFFRKDDDALNLILSELGAPNCDGLSYAHIVELHSKGLKSIAEILNAPDHVLLELKGIGKKKLEKIRSNIPVRSKG